ncbi:MAG: hypothetical protein WAM71_08735 [Candidatus Korobacteraceae bacterium]
MAASQQSVTHHPEQVEIALPSPTAWPFFLAIGAALLFAGLLTNASVSILGAIFFVVAAVGWFCQVLPHERHVTVEATVPAEAEALAAPEVLKVAAADKIQRAWLPLKVYPIVSGVRGGLAGGVAMAVIAILYGVIFARSIWYPINLIAGSLYAAGAMPSNQALMRFNPTWLLFAIALHLTVCTLVGLLYGAMLPMLPGRPILWGGIVAPLLWSGLVYSVLDFVNPLLDQKINWYWFAASQVAFGVVAGLVVVRHNKQWTTENVPLAMRAGIEAPGLMPERHDGDEGR